MRSRLRVSVVVCNHNYGHFIEQAIESVLDQTLAAHQILVVDDGSTDDSVRLVRQLQASLTLIEQPNRGQRAAYNTGFAAVTGDVVVFLDSDDRLLPDALASIEAAFADEQVARVHFRLALIDREGRQTGAVIPSHLAEGDLGDKLRAGILFLAAPGSGNAYRVSALRQIMPLPLDARDMHCADFFTGYGSALLGRVRVVGAAPLGQYRVHSQEMSGSLTFGNARLGRTQSEALHQNYQQLRDWLAQRCPAEKLRHSPVVDFSIEKQDYAAVIFNQPSYWLGLRAGFTRLSGLMASLRHRSAPWWVNWGLGGWALLVLLAPRAWGWPIARFVCNPGSRR